MQLKSTRFQKHRTAAKMITYSLAVLYHMYSDVASNGSSPVTDQN